LLYKNICYKLYLAHRKTHKIFFNVNLIFQYLVLKYISQTFYTNFYRFLHEFSFFVIISSVNYMVLIELVLLYCFIPFTFAHWKTLKWQILKCTNIYYYCSPLFWYLIQKLTNRQWRREFDVSYIISACSNNVGRLTAHDDKHLQNIGRNTIGKLRDSQYKNS